MEYNAMKYSTILSAKALSLGYLEINYAPLKIITLCRTAPGCDYLVTVLTGYGHKLSRRANFTTLKAARRFAKNVMYDLSTPAIDGVDSL